MNKVGFSVAGARLHLRGKRSDGRGWAGSLPGAARTGFSSYFVLVISVFCLFLGWICIHSLYVFLKVIWYSQSTKLIWEFLITTHKRVRISFQNHEVCEPRATELEDALAAHTPRSGRQPGAVSTHAAQHTRLGHRGARLTPRPPHPPLSSQDAEY